MFYILPEHILKATQLVQKDVFLRHIFYTPLP
jgi:hypothetical protein